MKIELNRWFLMLAGIAFFWQVMIYCRPSNRIWDTDEKLQMFINGMIIIHLLEKDEE